jgi:hypothetical protein
MELLTIICETAIDEEIHHLLDAVEAPGYTRFAGVTGMGATGRREGNPVWPGRNTIYYAAMEEDRASRFVGLLQELIRRESASRRLAVKVFSQPVTARI